MADFGYDISDFKSIDPLFGTMEDFDRLVEKAKSLGKWRIKFVVFLEFVELVKLCCVSSEMYACTSECCTS